MLEKWKKSADQNKTFDALLKDLSKAFYCLNHAERGSHWKTKYRRIHFTL